MRCRDVALVVGAIVGCAGTRSVLQAPIADECRSTGLRGCRDLTEGVLLYLEGDQRGARHKLHIAVNANEPEDVLAFADALKSISQIPGAGQFAAPVQNVIDILATEAKQAGEQPPSRRKKPAVAASRSSKERRADVEDAESSESNAVQGIGVVVDPTSKSRAPAVKPPVFLAQWRPEPPLDYDGKTVVPAADETNRPCTLTGTMAPTGESSKGYCVRVMRGPLVVTDLHSSNSCPAELFALAATVPGDLSGPRWAIYAQPLSAMNISGSTFIVRETEHLVIGVMSMSDQKIKRDVRCSITWSLIIDHIFS